MRPAGKTGRKEEEMITIITDKAMASKYIGRRTARVFTADEVSTAVASVRARAAERKDGRPAWEIANGGGVANKYVYPAHSQVLFVGAAKDGRAIVLTTNLPANKITLGGSISVALGSEARPALDERYGAAATKLAREYISRRVAELLQDATNLWRG